MQDWVVPKGIVNAKILRSDAQSGSFKNAVDISSAKWKIDKAQTMESERHNRIPLNNTRSASKGFPKAYFSEVNLEMAVSVPEAQREKQME